MRFQRIGLAAALAVMPLAGPVKADSELIQVAVNTAAAPDSAASVTLAAPLAVPQIAASKPLATGMASFYGASMRGARTASGQAFDPAALTAAHRTLPFGSQVQVTNHATGDSVIVTINDRGPFHGNRVIDLSEAAARQIGIARAGSGMVDIALVTPAS